MKRSKSRTLFSRTISRVRSRLSSFNSLTESPNPLRAPPSISSTIVTPTRTPKITSTDHPITHHDTITINGDVDDPISSAVDGAGDRREPALHPAIANLQLKTSAWTVFGTHPKYPATAYVNIDMACESTNVVRREQDDQREMAVRQYAGHLFDMSIEATLAGPGILIKQYGHTERQQMGIGDQWLVVLHMGIKDTSLASRLSTSFRSLGGRLGRISNVEVINRWLDVLHKDTVQQEEERQKLLVSLKVTFRHSLLPRTTLLVEERTIAVALTEGEVDRAKLEGVELICGDEEEDEERLMELRVLGAPWM